MKMTIQSRLATTSRACAITLVLMGLSQSANAALALDRTRVVLDGGDNAVSMGVTNQNKELPYLAQVWIDDAQGNKITSPLTALPPVQRIEPGAKTQVKVQATPGMNLLAQDRESLYYFNLREIPPKSSKPNTLQIALQTRIKLFYRPAALKVESNSKPWQEQVTLTKEGNNYVVHNPTPYYVTFTSVSPALGGESLKDFKPLMLEPLGQAPLGVSVSAVGNSPVLTYVNDYGGRPKLIFSCTGNSCTLKSTKVG